MHSLFNQECRGSQQGTGEGLRNAFFFFFKAQDALMRKNPKSGTDAKGQQEDLEREAEAKRNEGEGQKGTTTPIKT